MYRTEMLPHVPIKILLEESASTINIVILEAENTRNHFSILLRKGCYSQDKYFYGNKLCTNQGNK